MALHHIFKNIEYDGVAAIDNLLGTLHRLDDAALNELADDERLIELGGHELGQTALAHFEFRANDDDGTSGIIHTLTEEILTETSLLTLQRIGERLEGTIALALDGT